MPNEKRTRVEVFLPLSSDVLAYQSAIDWLAEEFAFERGGSTLTAPFAGFFVSSTQTDVVEDAIRVLFCDFELDATRPEDETEIVGLLENVKEFLMTTLEEEVWVIYYPVTRVVSLGGIPPHHRRKIS